MKDFNDIHQQQGLKAVRDIINGHALRVYNIDEFLKLEIPPREEVLAPILQTQGLAMIFAPRGIGKTHVALGMAYAVASGGNFLDWTAPVPRRVIYVDGEMTAHAMQARLAAIVAKGAKKAAPDFFSILTPDMQELGMPDISTPEGQRALEPFITDAEFIVIDNISTLARSGKENEAESWLPMQDWILSMRRRGKSVLLVHHAGKGGQQRGTSRREDVLDLVISLRRPADYQSTQGARFEVHFEKARHLTGADAQPIEAMLTDNGWKTKNVGEDDVVLVMGLANKGHSAREIQAATGISKSRVNRMIKEASHCPTSRARDSGTADISIFTEET